MSILRTTLLTALGILLTSFISFAQDSQDNFQRKGKVLIESGYEFTSLFSGGSGVSVISVDGTTITSIGFDGGYMVTNDLALKLRINRINIEGESLTALGGGAKYYIAEVVPLDVSLGVLTADDNSEFRYGASVGYAIGLADNVNLEPYGGFFRLEGQTYSTFGARFAMFL